MKNIRFLSFSFFLFTFSFASHAQAPHLWVTASGGGLYNAGTILESDSTGMNFHVVWNFDHPVAALPTDNLVLASNGKLYGTSLLGGYQDSCVIYSYDTSTNFCDSVYNFMYHPEFGEASIGGLTLATNGKLYGIANEYTHNGVLFSFDPITNVYTDEYNFSSGVGGYAQGGLIQATDGNLYGMTSGNLIFSEASVIYRFNPVSHVYTVMVDLNDSTGFGPAYTHLIQAANGKLYGMVGAGGSYTSGAIICFNIGDSSVTRLHSFNGYDGSNPFGSLIQASNGKLYGMTYQGGDSSQGNIFCYDITNNIFTNLYSFQNSTGMYPERDLFELSNGLLLGTTYYGGAYNRGVIFSYDISSNVYTDILDFDSATTGSNPISNIIETPRVFPASVTNLNNNHNPLTIYPNPVSDYLTIQGLASNTQIEITDVAGRVVFTQSAVVGVSPHHTNVQIDMRGYQAGVYLLHCGSEVKKIIKL